MKRVMQAVRSNLYPEDIEGWSRWCDRFILHDNLADLYTADPTVPLVGGLNLAYKEFKWWMRQRRPFICFNRPHIGGWANAYPMRARRVSVNSYACTSFGRRTHDRWGILDLPRHPWKVREVRNVLVAPPGKSVWYYLRKSEQEWADEQVAWFRERGANVRLRTKKQAGKGKGGRYSTLWEALDWADLVVSFSSAVTVEAFWYGKKVISPGVCPTWPCGTNSYENWQDPTEPANRAEWHEHAAWTQFTEAEWRSGAAQDMIVAYQGHPLDVRPPDNDYFD